MLNPDHPTAVLRHAWRHIRIDAIRTVARATIVELEDGTRADLLVRYETRGAPEPTFSATAKALWVCCNEVREEAGLTAVGAEIVPPAPEADPAWQAVYLQELERYRAWAGEVLVRRLAPLT